VLPWKLVLSAEQIQKGDLDCYGNKCNGLCSLLARLLWAELGLPGPVTLKRRWEEGSVPGGCPNISPVVLHILLYAPHLELLAPPTSTPQALSLSSVCHGQATKRNEDSCY